VFGYVSILQRKMPLISQAYYVYLVCFACAYLFFRFKKMQTRSLRAQPLTIAASLLLFLSLYFYTMKVIGNRTRDARGFFHWAIEGIEASTINVLTKHYLPGKYKFGGKSAKQ
jgi:hypothetical protein